MEPKASLQSRRRQRIRFLPEILDFEEQDFPTGVWMTITQTLREGCPLEYPCRPIHKTWTIVILYSIAAFFHWLLSCYRLHNMGDGLSSNSVECLSKGCGGMLNYIILWSYLKKSKSIFKVQDLQQRESF